MSCENVYKFDESQVSVHIWYDGRNSWVIQLLLLHSIHSSGALIESFLSRHFIVNFINCNGCCNLIYKGNFLQLSFTTIVTVDVSSFSKEFFRNFISQLNYFCANYWHSRSLRYVHTSGRSTMEKLWRENKCSSRAVPMIVNRNRTSFIHLPWVSFFLVWTSLNFGCKFFSSLFVTTVPQLHC